MTLVTPLLLPFCIEELALAGEGGKFILRPSIHNIRLTEDIEPDGLSLDEPEIRSFSGYDAM